MATREYSDEELNYFRVCHVATCEIPNGLRDVFKQEWDTRYATSHGKWQDTAKNGIDFFGMEKKTHHNKQALSIIRNGNTLEWDCTTLFHAILYSKCISRCSLSPVIQTRVDELRVFRNKTFAHVADGKVSSANFQSSMQKVIDAFQDLKLDTSKIELIKNQTSFPTDELQKVHQLLNKERKQNEEPHPFCSLPPKPSYDPIQRVDEVLRIEGEMRRLRDETPSEVTVCYISGNPGCGKSEMARQIGERFFDNAPPSSTTQVTFVNTLNASSIDTLLQSYEQLASCLNFDEDSITRIGTSKDLTPEEKVVHLRGLIAPRVQRYSSWLMIVDNVTDLKLISKYLWQAGDRTNGEGQILVTTQDSRSIPQDSYCWHLSLSTGMSETDSIKTLCHISGLVSCDEKTVLQVAKALDFQPLALACAATYVRRVCNTNPSFTWQKYLQKLEEGKREVTEKVYKETSLTYQNTMTAAVRIAVEKERSQDVVMKHVFEFLSTLAPEPLPLKYVMSYAMSCAHEEDEDLLAVKISSSSLILYSSETQEIHVHQVIHSYLCATNANVSKSHLLLAIDAFSSLKSFDPDIIDDVIATKSLVVHFVTLQTNLSNCFNVDKSSFNRNMVDSFSSMGEICSTHGCYQSAKTFYELALAFFSQKQHIFKRIFSPIRKSPMNNIKCSICNKLANVLRQLGQYMEAKTYLEKALAIRNETSQATTMRNLAALYIDIGQYNKSKKCAEKALKMQGKGEDQDNASLAATLNCLGKALMHLGLYREAKEQLGKALGIQEMIYSTKHPTLVPTLQNLANALHKMGQYQEATDCSQRALDIQKHVFHECHPALATTLTSLANILHDMGKYKEALEKMEEVLDIKKEAYDQSHPIFAPTYMNLANILRDLKKYQEAETYLEKALDVQAKTFGENHPEIAVTLNSMANVLTDKLFHQRYARFVCHKELLNDALSHLQRALTIQEKVYGKTHPELAVTLNNLGSIYSNIGNEKEAERYLKRSLEIKEITYDEHHPSVAKALNNLAVLLVNQKHYRKAILYFERALSIQERAYDHKHPLIAITLFNLAQTLDGLGDKEGATQCFERAEISSTSSPKCLGNLHHQISILKHRYCFERAEIAEMSLLSSPKCLGNLHHQICIFEHEPMKQHQFIPRHSLNSTARKMRFTQNSLSRKSAERTIEELYAF